MSFASSLRLRRGADKVRAAGWINVIATLVGGYFFPDKVMAVIVGCLWIVFVLAVVQFTAWRMDVKANRTARD